VAGRRVAAGGTLVLDSEGLSKLAAGDALARAHLETARSRRARAATALERERPVVLLTSDPDDPATLTEEPARPKAQRIVVAHV
jgi:hypothetical protein